MMIYKSTYKQNIVPSNNFSDIFPQEDELMKDFDRFLEDNQVYVTNEIDEFERYLIDPLLSRGTEPFDVLSWWKENESRYPSVSLMARDILAIPITSVASESVRFLTEYCINFPTVYN